MMLCLHCRFGVSDLVQLCEQVPAMADLEGEQLEASEDCESRAFQELLRSVWNLGRRKSVGGRPSGAGEGW